ncbi:MAG: molybdopterin-dependent oxidoreductase [Pseudomonadota bacterium]
MASIATLLPGLTLAVLLAGAAQAQSVAVTGADGASVTLSAADLAALPRRMLTLSVHGESHVFEGPTLASVLKDVRAPLGEDLRGQALLTYVTVRAADGYGVVLSLAEIDPALSPTAVLLADEVDGAPIDAEEGPFRLVVEGDARPARSVRHVTSITVSNAD